MTNPARHLHTIFTGWFDAHGNTQEVARALSKGNEAPEVTATTIAAMNCLVEIDRRLPVLEAEGRRVTTYRRMLPTWTHAVMMYPEGFGVVASISDHALDTLDHLAEILELTTPTIRTGSPERVTDLLDRVTAMLGTDESLPAELRRYLFRLVQETRTALVEYQTLGAFDLNESLMRLWTAVNAAAEVSTDEGAKEGWRGIVRDYAIGTVAGLTANAPAFVQAAITAAQAVQ